MQKFWQPIAVLLLGAHAASVLSAQPLKVSIDGRSTGKVFDGIGATSASTSYLLYDYPEPQRSQVLDYLFKPNYGASLQLLKIEVGGDGNSTIVSEPSHMRTAAEANYQRGVEWWLATEALKRNPDIKIVALAWSFPKWVESATSRYKVDPEKAASYLTEFVLGAKQHHGIELYCMGAWNEIKVDTRFFVALKRNLTLKAPATKVCGDDTFKWEIVDRMKGDEKLRDSIDVITNHYPKYKTPAEVQAKSVEWQKPIWSGEEGPWVEEWGSSGNFSGPFPAIFNRNYIGGRLTSTNIWALVSSYYNIGPILHAGLMRADTPWSGYYEVTSPIWAVAHTTQFAQPGWRYIDSASGLIPKTGSYVTLRKDENFSVVVETMRGGESKELEFAVSGGLSTGPIAVWRSNATSQFEQLEQVQPIEGRFTYRFDPQSVYSLTTTTGQSKGNAAPPPENDFPVPWHADFSAVPLGRTPPLFAVANGGYDVVECPGGRTGHCLRQVLGTFPVLWGNGKGSPWIKRTGDIPPTASPALAGDLRWRDYRVSADVFIEQAGEASIIGRASNIDGAGVFTGYRFRLYDSGKWILHGDSRDKELLAAGQFKRSLRVWRRMELILHDTSLVGRIDGEQVFALTDDRQAAGLAGIGTNFNKASFDKFSVDKVSDDVPVISVPPVRAPYRAPDPVVDLFLPIPGDGNVTLNWKAVAQADGYRLRYGLDPKKLDQELTLGKVNRHVVSGLQNGKMYHFVLAAFNAKGEGDRSYVQTGTPGAE